MTDTPPPRTLSTTETTFEILEALKRNDGARVTELAEELDIVQSTFSQHLRTAERKLLAELFS